MCVCLYLNLYCVPQKWPFDTASWILMALRYAESMLVVHRFAVLRCFATPKTGKEIQNCWMGVGTKFDYQLIKIDEDIFFFEENKDMLVSKKYIIFNNCWKLNLFLCVSDQYKTVHIFAEEMFPSVTIPCLPEGETFVNMSKGKHINTQTHTVGAHQTCKRQQLQRKQERAKVHRHWCCLCAITVNWVKQKFMCVTEWRGGGGRKTVKWNWQC